jgi:hypothetical protein
MTETHPQNRRIGYARVGTYGQIRKPASHSHSMVPGGFEVTS